MENKAINSAYQYAFIGAGNMAQAMMAGLIRQGLAPARIIASTKTVASSEKLTASFGVKAVQDNSLCLDADTIILAVKPQVLKAVLNEIDRQKLQEKLVITVIAGIPAAFYYDLIGSRLRLVRLMPNTPSLIGAGMTGAFAGENCSADDRETAKTLLQGIGQCLWVQTEQGIDYVNAISGSGPAYFYYFIQCIAKKGEALGLSYEDAETLAIQTALGTSQLCLEQSDGNPERLQSLIDQVTSKGGTTIEAIDAFKRNNLAAIVDEAIQACYDRALVIGETYTK